MISSVTVTNLRGIKSGALADLTPLTILVGPNGSGKSTVLDALSMGAARNPLEAVGDAVRRRLSRQSTARWLFPAQLNGPAVIHIPFAEGLARNTTLTWRGTADGAVNGQVQVSLSEPGQVPFGNGTVSFFEGDATNGVWQELIARQVGIRSTELRFIDMRFGAAGAPDLVDVLTAAKAEGRAAFAREILKEVVPSLDTLEILKVGQGFGVSLVNDQSGVPLAVSGDGVRGLARLALELAAQPGGLVLVEEPEVHQHPKSLRMSAKVIVAAVKREIQVVLATHSLELIDNLIEFAESEKMIDQLTVQRLLLADGQLDAKRIPGDQAKRIRSELELELR